MKNGDVILASEVGVLEVPEEDIVLKERLHPGKMLLVDTRQGKIFQDEEIKEKYTTKQPYGEWLDSNLVELHDLKIPNMRVEEYEEADFVSCRKLLAIPMKSIKTPFGIWP